MSNSPEDRLSTEAKHRIWAAYEEGRLIVDRVVADLHIRWTSEYDLLPSQMRALDQRIPTEDYARREGWMDFEDFCFRKGALELSAARMEAARRELVVIQAEYSAVTTGRELWKLMQEQVRHVFESSRLTEPQQNVIWGELRPALYRGTAAPNGSQSVIPVDLIAKLNRHIAATKQRNNGQGFVSKAKFYKALKIDKADYYRWERGEELRAPEHKPRIEDRIANLSE